MAIIQKNKKNEPATVEAHELISSSEVEQIRRTLIETNADLVVRGMLDKSAREQLEKIVKREFNQATKGNPDVISYVVRETIGTGVIEEILQDENITDIGYNGKELIIETNDDKIIYDTNFEITEAYIVRLVNKFANANNKEFTSKNPIFDGRFENIRINAVHSQNTAPESGTTMSLRVVRPRLALTEDNFEGFAPMFILDFFKAAAISKANIVISGTTGTGKTELHKLIAGFIPFEDRILLIEDTPETFMKEMYPEKDVYSWVTSEDVSVTPLIKAGLRNHPIWIMVTETRGAEAYEMIQAVLSGHSIITSLHATKASAIPSRFVNMSKMGYQLEESALIDDVNRYFHLGVHIKKTRYKKRVVRYLDEIIMFDPDGPKTIFKQRFIDGIFHFETFDIPDEFTEMMEDAMTTLDFPENFKSERPLDIANTTFEATIPLDATGRPDYKKIEEMGTTLGILMGREKPDFDPNEDSIDPSDYNITKDGYIAPEVGEIKSEEERRVEQLKKELEEKSNKEAEERYKRDTLRKTEGNQRQNIEKNIQSVLDSVKTSVAKPEKESKVVVPKRRKKKERSIEEILEEKKRLIRDSDDIW